MASIREVVAMVTEANVQTGEGLGAIAQASQEAWTIAGEILEARRFRSMLLWMDLARRQ